MRLFHRHRWVVLRVQPMRWALINNETGEQLHGLDRPLTDVYERCACGEARVKTLEGRWSLEELLGGRPPANTL